MSDYGNKEDNTGLDYCGGLKEGDEGPVMGIDLFQTGGTSKSAQDTAHWQGLLVMAYYQSSLHTCKGPLRFLKGM